MDVGFYLGELLMQQGEVSVPGLGYFVQARVSGYYDESERKFFPPYHQAQFDPQSIDDDALAEYIAGKKNISIASARYFAEKYITNLKQQALITEVPIGNLGWFYTELAQLTFRPAAKIIDDTIFFGFEPVSVSKANDIRPFEERPKLELDFTNRTVSSKPAVAETINDTFVSLPSVNDEPAAMPTYETQPQSHISPEFFDPEEEHSTSSFNGPLRAVVFVLVGIIVIGLGIFALHTYQPDTFAKIAFWKQKQAPVVVATKPKPTPLVKPADSLTGDSLKADTGRIAATPVKTDTVVQQAATKSKIISEVPVDQTTRSKSKIISEVPVDANAKPKTRILSVTPVDQGKAITKTTIQVSKTPVNPTATPLLSTSKKKETVVSRQTLAASSPVITKPAGAKTKPVVTGKVSSTTLNAKPSDAVGTRRYEVYATRGSTTIAEANVLIKKLRKAGLDPRVVSDAPGTLIHISIGHFTDRDEAKSLAAKEIDAGHIPGGESFPLEIIPQK